MKNNFLSKYGINKNAITLISLIITVILLLILAGVTINLTIGKNSILQLAQETRLTYTKQNAKEKLELVLLELQMNKTTDEKYNENDYIDTRIQENGMKINENIVLVDDYKFIIDRTIPQIAIILGKEKEGNIKFIYNPSLHDTEWTNDRLEITIETQMPQYQLQYSLDNQNWNNYEEVIIMEQNGIIYARLINDLYEVIDYSIEKVTNIDKEAPITLEIALTPAKTSVRVDITKAEDAKATIISGESGIAEYRYRINNETWSNWTTDTFYTFNEIYGDLAGVDCIIDVEVKDKAENIKKVSSNTKTTCLNTTYYTKTRWTTYRFNCSNRCLCRLYYYKSI